MWAAGVTYERSRVARMEETAGAETFYDKVYTAERPELFFKGAANGLFAAGADQLRRDGVDDLEALRIGIRCERGSHRFFKRYGERFEDSEGKQIFLEFAEEERQHLELLIREYRSLVSRQRRRTKDSRRRRSA